MEVSLDNEKVDVNLCIIDICNLREYFEDICVCKSSGGKLHVKENFSACTVLATKLALKCEQGVQGLQMFEFCVVNINDEHTKYRLKKP